MEGASHACIRYPVGAGRRKPAQNPDHAEAGPRLLRRAGPGGGHDPPGPVLPPEKAAGGGADLRDPAEELHLLRAGPDGAGRGHFVAGQLERRRGS